MATARLDGADTAAMTPMPHTAAFCTISKLTRPETMSTHPAQFGAGWPSPRTARPATLSTALWRPTSSRTHQRVAGRIEEAGGVQAAGSLERRLRLSQAGRAAGR